MGTASAEVDLPVTAVLEATNASIAEAVKAKLLDETLSAGPIAAVRKIAEQIDHPDYPVVDGRFDNVSMSLYLKYCIELHLTPAPVDEKAQKGGESGGSKLGKLRSVHSA